jgi:hypothetical protein
MISVYSSDNIVYILMVMLYSVQKVEITKIEKRLKKFKLVNDNLNFNKFQKCFIYYKSSIIMIYYDISSDEIWLIKTHLLFALLQILTELKRYDISYTDSLYVQFNNVEKTRDHLSSLSCILHHFNSLEFSKISFSLRLL